MAVLTLWPRGGFCRHQEKRCTPSSMLKLLLILGVRYDEALLQRRTDISKQHIQHPTSDFSSATQVRLQNPQCTVFRNIRLIQSCLRSCRRGRYIFKLIPSFHVGCFSFSCPEGASKRTSDFCHQKTQTLILGPSVWHFSAKKTQNVTSSWLTFNSFMSLHLIQMCLNQTRDRGNHNSVVVVIFFM